MICAGFLLLAAHYSSGNPLPTPPCGASESTCNKWTLDTNSMQDSITQVTNGISVYTQITPTGPVLSEPSQSLVCILYYNTQFKYILLFWWGYSAAGGQGVHPRSADRLPDALPLPSISHYAHQH